MTRADLVLQAVAAVLIVTGFLSYLLIDPDTGPWRYECETVEGCPTPQWWQDSGTVRALLATFGIFGLGLLGWAFALRLIRSRV